MRKSLALILPVLLIACGSTDTTEDIVNNEVSADGASSADVLDGSTPGLCDSSLDAAHEASHLDGSSEGAVGDSAVDSVADQSADTSCQSECVVGQARCSGDQTQACENNAGCGKWGTVKDCAQGLQCRVAGACFFSADLIFYVSTGGNDNWTGKIDHPTGSDGPFATIEKARDTVRALRKAGQIPGGVHVLIRSGSYILTSPIAFSPADSGTQAQPVNYENYPAERPIFQGAKTITGWNVAAGVWKVNLPDVANGKWNFSSLWSNGSRKTRARSPNTGYFRTAGTVTEQEKRAFKFGTGDLQQYTNQADAEVEIYHAWSTSRQKIASINTQTDVITFVSDDNYAYEYFGPSQRYVIENVPEALDQPGEWYLNRASGDLTYLPQAGETPATTTLVAPVVTQWLQFNGTSATPIGDIQIRGIDFAYADWLVGPKGVAEGQAATVMNSAVEVNFGQRIVLDNLGLNHANNYGVWFRNGSEACVLSHSELGDLGGGGVRIGETSLTTAQNNSVDNNYIHDDGQILKGAVGVWIGRSSNNQVSHNEIADLYYTGVSVGWSWGYESTTAHDNIVRDNHIHHIGKGELSDMGGIYSLGVSPGTKVLHNHIHDVQDFSYGGWGLYTDEGSSEIELRSNLVHSTRSAPFHQHYGENNTIANNILAFGVEGQIRRSREHPDDQHSFDITNNIVIYNNAFLLEGVWTNGLYTLAKNLYWNTNGPVLFNCLTLAEWQAKGQDINSVVADPLFKNPSSFDFTLDSNSPALSIGFVPFSLNDFGLYGEDDWIKKPTQKTYGPSYLPTWPPTDWHQGFETTDIGQLPSGMNVDGTTTGASIAVSDEQAYEGKRSVKLADHAGLNPSWMPYFYFNPQINAGTVTVSYAFRRGAGAPIWVELRDNRSPYVAGPSVRVSETGALIASGKNLGITLPSDTWVRVTLKASLGKTSGLYDLTVEQTGQSPQQFKSLGSADPSMCNLSWFGFVGIGDGNTVVYLDDLNITTTN